MRVAIIHDWLVTYTGAEKVLEQLIILYPHADIFTIVDFLPEKDRSFLKDNKIYTSFIQNLPFARKQYRNYLPLMPLAIEQFDLSKYDVVLSSSHAVAKGIITGPNQPHISYIHTPIRYAWDLQHQYLAESNLIKGIKSFMVRGLLHYLRLWDYRTATGVDYYITNSSFIKSRLWKTYRRGAEVIYPPVNTDSFTFSKEKKDFYLTASRLVPYKKVDLIVEAFSRMPEKKLIVIGDGPDMSKIKNKASGNITILGYQPFEKLIEYMQSAKAFVFAAEEDFGITPVEAQSCGTPVIAFGKGGSLETVKDINIYEKPTGVLFYRQDIDSIIDGVKRFESYMVKIKAEYCREHALGFSEERFRKQFYSFVEDKLNKYDSIDLKMEADLEMVVIK